MASSGTRPATPRRWRTPSSSSSCSSPSSSSDCSIGGCSINENARRYAMAVAQQASLVLTEEQRWDFDEKGYIILEDFFAPEEFARLLAAIDEVGERIRRAKNLTE